MPHTEPSRVFRVVGYNRKQGAIGAHEPFVIDVEAVSVDDAEHQARAARAAAGFEHVLIRAVVPVTDVSAWIGELSDSYWRARRAPGGTIVDPETEAVSTSAEAHGIFEQLDAVDRAAAAENAATLRRCGVPVQIVNATVGSADLTVDAEQLRWVGPMAADPAVLDRVVSPPLRLVEEWSNGARWVWTDDARLIVTYCEGDVSGQYFLSPEAFTAGFQSAAEFYRGD